MNDDMWLWGVRLAGGFHLLTVLLAHFTPVPPNWDANVANLPPVHRRFALAQNVFIGATMIVAGIISLVFARELVSGSTGGRIICGAISLWWAARLAVLPWLRVWPELTSRALRAGFVLLHLECALFAVVYGWLALAR